MGASREVPVHPFSHLSHVTKLVVDRRRVRGRPCCPSGAVRASRVAHLHWGLRECRWTAFEFPGGSFRGAMVSGIGVGGGGSIHGLTVAGVGAGVGGSINGLRVGTVRGLTFAGVGLGARKGVDDVTIAALGIGSPAVRKLAIAPLIGTSDARGIIIAPAYF